MPNTFAESVWPVNTHIHLPPNFTVFNTVADAVAAGAREGIRILGASNYYDYTVYHDFERQARKHGIYPLFGMEIVARDEVLAGQGIKANDPGNPGKVYICGKATTGDGSGLAAGPEAIRRRIRDGDAERMAQMTERIAAVFSAAGLDTALDNERVRQMVIRRHGAPPQTVYLQERHIALAFQTWLWENVPADKRAERLSAVLGAEVKDAADPVKAQDAIRSHLMKTGKPGFIAEKFVSVEEARQLVLGFGGVPCYPLFADGAGAINAFEAPVGGLIERLRERGIHAVEFITTRNSAEVLSEYVPALRRAGFVVTAGTEHNTLEDFPLEPFAKGGAALPEDVRAIFAEGALALVGHQTCSRRGKTGLVDGEGEPNPAYPDADIRIASLARIGANAI